MFSYTISLVKIYFYVHGQNRIYKFQGLQT